MERLILKYQRARNQWHIMFHKFEESERRPEHYFSKYKDTKKQLKDANKRIAELEEIMQEKDNIIEMKNNLLHEQDQIIQEKEDMLDELQGTEKECKYVRIHLTQGNCHNKGK